MRPRSLYTLLVVSLSLISIVGAGMLQPPRVGHASGSQARGSFTRADQAAITDASQLEIPYTAFPTSFSVTASNLEGPSAADELTIESAVHHTSYVDLGMEAGWYEEAQQSLESGNFILSYLGSYYQSPAAALNVLNDAISGIPATSCAGGSRCSQITVPLTDADGNDATATVRLIAVGSVLFEGAYMIDNADLAGQASVGDGALNSMTLAFLSLSALRPPTPTPTVPATPAPTLTPTVTATPLPDVGAGDFHVWVRVERSDAAPDWNQVTPPLKRVKVGTKIRLSIYLALSSTHAASAISSNFTVTQGSHILFQQSLPETLSSGPPGTSWYHALLRLQTPGTYVFTGQVLINGHPEHGRSIVVADKKDPPPLPPVSFSFDHMQIQNSRGVARQSFRTTDTVWIQVVWTVRNLRSTVPVDIILVPQVRGPGGWRPFRNPTPRSFDTFSGQHFYKSGFVPPDGLTGKLKFRVGITIGPTTRQKSETIQIKR